MRLLLLLLLLLWLYVAGWRAEEGCEVCTRCTTVAVVCCTRHVHRICSLFPLVNTTAACPLPVTPARHRRRGTQHHPSHPATVINVVLLHALPEADEGAVGLGSAGCGSLLLPLPLPRRTH